MSVEDVSTNNTWFFLFIVAPNIDHQFKLTIYIYYIFLRYEMRRSVLWSATQRIDGQDKYTHVPDHSFHYVFIYLTSTALSLL